jgi:hypothetical protein
MTSHNAGVTTHKIKWCDLRCEYADFAKLGITNFFVQTFGSAVYFCAQARGFKSLLHLAGVRYKIVVDGQ